MVSNKPRLFLVPVPIGNYLDMTPRAIEVVQNAELLIFESYQKFESNFSRYIKVNELHAEKILLNEHTNKPSYIQELVNEILNYENSALISDAGTPVFSDPGSELLASCHEYDIEIISLPGANSLTPALAGSGFKPDRFFCWGWLAQNREKRLADLRYLKSIRELIVIYDTPYKLPILLDEIERVFHPNIQISVAFEISTPEEKIIFGSISKVKSILQGKKGNFVLIIDNR